MNIPWLCGVYCRCREAEAQDFKVDPDRESHTHRSMLHKGLYLILKGLKIRGKYFASTDLWVKYLVQAVLPILIEHTHSLTLTSLSRELQAADISFPKPSTSSAKARRHYTSTFGVCPKTRVQPRMWTLAHLGGAETYCFTLCLSLRPRHADICYKTSSEVLRYLSFTVILITESSSVL